MEEIISTDRVRNEVLQRVKRGRNILDAIKGRKANWFVTSCLGTAFWNHDVERKIE